MEKGYQKGDETPQGQLKNDLLNLISQWEELGIEPDDFAKCGVCHEYFIDEQGNLVDCKCDREEKEKA